MRLRPATSADAPSLYRLYYRAVHETPGTFYTARQRRAWASDPVMPDGFGARFDGTTAIVAEDGVGPLAFMVLTPAGCLDLAYADPRARNMPQRPTDAVYRMILEAAEAKGMTRLETEASHYARRYLARRGWQETRRFEKTLRGVVFDQVEMELYLSPKASR